MVDDMFRALLATTSAQVAVVDVKLYSAWAKPRLLVKAYRRIDDPVAS